MTGNDARNIAASTILALLTLLVWAGSALADCTNPAMRAGSVFYNDSALVLQYCDGMDWIAMHGTGAGSGGCTNPAMGEGTMFYNFDHYVMQVCAGNVWRGMGPLGDDALGIPSGGLDGHWKLDETSGTTATDSAGSNDGSLQGGLDPATDSVSGVYGSALAFDGTDDYINVGDLSAVKSLPYTITAWIKLDQLPSTAGNNLEIFNKFGAAVSSFRFGVNAASDKLRFDNYGSDCSGQDNHITASTAYGVGDVGVWKHVSIVFTSDSSGTVTLYENGSQVQQATNSGAACATAGDVAIGARSNGTDPFEGSLDDVRIYNRALSVSELQDIYNASSHNVGLVGHWKFDETSGTTAADSAGSYDGDARNVEDSDWVDAQISNGLELDGTNEMVEVPHNAVFYQVPFTASMWVKLDILPSASGNQFVLMEKRHDGTPVWYSWSLKASSSTDEFYLTAYDSGGSYAGNANADNALVAGQWYHVAATLDASYNVTLYIDGVAQADTFNAGSLYASTEPFTIGGISPGDNKNLDGVIDDARFYDRVLSAAEVQQLYGCTNPSDRDGAIIYNSSNAVMQYCNGRNWVGIGK